MSPPTPMTKGNAMHVFRSDVRRYLPGIVSNLSPEWRSALSLGRVCQQKKGTFLISSPESRTFGFLTRGRICSIHSSGSGGAQTMLFFGPDTLFRETYMFSGFCLSLPHFQALTDVEFCLFEGDMLHDKTFAATHTLLMTSMLYSVTVKLSLFDALLSIKSCKSVEEKVAMWLYYCFDVKGRRSFSPGISQLELSLLLGVHKSSLNKAILRFKSHGILGCFTKTQISILEEKRLFAVANGAEVLD